MCWDMWRSLACPSTSRTLFSGLRVSTHGKQVAPYSVRFLLTSQEGGVGPILPRVPHGDASFGYLISVNGGRIRNTIAFRQKGLSTKRYIVLTFQKSLKKRNIFSFIIIAYRRNFPILDCSYPIDCVEQDKNLGVEP